MEKLPFYSFPQLFTNASFLHECDSEQIILQGYNSSATWKYFLYTKDIMLMHNCHDITVTESQLWIAISKVSSKSNIQSNTQA